jgi:hypothetical protein
MWFQQKKHQGQHNRNFNAKLRQFFLRNINKLLTLLECFSTYVNFKMGRFEGVLLFLAGKREFFFVQSDDENTEKQCCPK